MQDDQLEIGENQVRSLFETISKGYQPSTDLVPGALTAARRATRRRTISFTLAAGALAAVGSLAAIAFIPGSGTLAPTSVSAGSGGSANSPSPAIIRECTGRYLPWTSGSDASFYGKGSNSQRITICEQDLSTLARLLPGFEVHQGTETYSLAINEMMPSQVAQLGSGTKPITLIFTPWQYTVVSRGIPANLAIEYSRDADGLQFCHPCSMNTPLAHGFTLVDTIKTMTSGISEISGVQLRTPQGENIIVYLNVTNLDVPKIAINLVKLAENPEFTAMLAADLDIIGDN